MLQCLKKMGVDRQMIFNQNHAEDAVSQKKTTQIDVSVFFLHLTCSGCQAFSNGIDCLDVVRDSCSCFFCHGVTMGKSQMLFTEKNKAAF